MEVDFVGILSVGVVMWFWKDNWIIVWLYTIYCLFIYLFIIL